MSSVFVINGKDKCCHIFMFQVLMQTTQVSPDSDGFWTICLIFIACVVCPIVGMIICITLLIAILECIRRLWRWFQGYQALPHPPPHIAPPNLPVPPA